MKCMELKNALYDRIVACGTMDRVNGLTTIQEKIITHIGFMISCTWLSLLSLYTI